MESGFTLKRKSEVTGAFIGQKKGGNRMSKTKTNSTELMIMV
jgi:hypothetical protein